MRGPLSLCSSAREYMQNPILSCHSAARRAPKNYPLCAKEERFLGALGMTFFCGASLNGFGFFLIIGEPILDVHFSLQLGNPTG